MKVLVTGAAGFIGSQMAHRFLNNGDDLILIDNFSFGHEDNLIFDDRDLRDEVIRLDIRDKGGIESLFKNNNIDYVYNIAGIAPLPDCQLDPVEALSVNVGGVLNLLENGRKYGIRKFIQASTNAMYENETVFPTKEDNFKAPTLIYPNTKFSAEHFIQSYCDTYGMNATCLRFANVYGPHVDCLRKQPPFVAYMVRELYYDRTPIFHSTGEQRRDYVYVDDLIDLAIDVRDTEGFDAVNVSSNTNYSVNEMYELAEEIMNKQIKPEYASDAHYWENYPGLYEGAYPIKESVLKHEINKYSLCDNTYAKEKYGWEPKISMKEGLSHLIENECRLLDGLKEE